MGLAEWIIDDTCLAANFFFNRLVSLIISSVTYNFQCFS